MNKKQILTQLRLAKADHIDWIKQGHYLLDGVAQDKIKKPLTCHTCHFGKWYESEGYKLVNIPQLKTLESIHEEVHSLYTAIYYITFDRRRQARATLISAGVEIPVEELASRDQKIKLLEKKVVTMVRMLGDIEKQVVTMKEESLDSVWLQ